MSSSNELEFFRMGLNIREKLGRPHYDDITASVTDTVSQVTKQIDELLQNESSLESVVQGLKGEPDVPKTVAYVTARFLDSIGSSINQAGFQVTEVDDDYGKRLAVGMLDLAYGFSTTTQAVLLAHKPTEYLLLDPEAEYDKRSMRILKEDYVRIMRYRQRQLTSVVGLLQDKPTGYSVLDWQINEFHTFDRDDGGWIKHFRVPEFVIAGAELARDTYIKAYPTAEKSLYLFYI